MACRQPFERGDPNRTGPPDQAGCGWASNLNDLTGPVPPELGHLTSLEILDLSYNYLVGPLPAEFGNLAHLEKLHLAGSGLNGAIPPELGRLSRLKELILNGNNLTGTIPAELGDMSNLERLHLFNNHLEGAIPPELGRLVNLQELALDSNRLTGSVPTELANLANLREFRVVSNPLSGCVPGAFRGRSSNDTYSLGLPYCDELTPLTLCSNGIAVAEPGRNPGLVEDCATLLEIKDLLAGGATLGWSERTPMPEWQGVSLGGEGDLLRVTALLLEGAGLSGVVPPQLARLSQLEELWLQDNRLTGEIPAQLGLLDNLEWLWLHGKPAERADSRPNLAGWPS